MTSPQNYIVESASPALTLSTDVVANVDLRHTGGAIVAFLDGHVAYEPGSAITPVFFTPALAPTDLLAPLDLGPISATPLLTIQMQNKNTMSGDPYNTLNGLGLTTLLYCNRSTNTPAFSPSQPSWISSAAFGASSGPTNYGYNGGYTIMYWGGNTTVVPPMFGGTSGSTTYTMTFTTGPTVSGAKRLAMIYGDNNWNTYLQIKYLDSWGVTGSTGSTAVNAVGSCNQTVGFDGSQEQFMAADVLIFSVVPNTTYTASVTTDSASSNMDIWFATTPS
jgi:prepilin-type processing-associated H-X9-DG protein